MSKFLWAGVTGPVGICLDENLYDFALKNHVYAKATFDFSEMPDKLREQCVTALRYGYMTSERVKRILAPIADHFKFPIGFVGKTQAYLALPDAPEERLKEIWNLVDAAVSMRGMKRYSRINFAEASGVRSRAYIVVEINLRSSSSDPDAPIVHRKADRLLPRLEFMKGLAKDLAAETFPERVKAYNLFYNKQTLEIEFSGIPKPRVDRVKRKRRRRI